MNTSEKGNLPNLIIIGAQKCATTSLHYYLNLHPQILMSKQKELNFFIRERNWNKGIDWYRSNFTGEAKVYGESSPNYTNHPLFNGVAERMHCVVPDTKLIYVLRDPIERIIAHYGHTYAEGSEHRKIEDALKYLDDTNSYILRSKYFMQLKQYLTYFPKSNILITTLEDLFHNQRQILQEIFNFLNVDESFYSLKFLRILHKSKYKRQKTRTGLYFEKTPLMRIIKLLPPEMQYTVEKIFYLPLSRKVERPILHEKLRETLIDHLKHDIHCLRKYTGRDFEDWCM